MNHTAQFRHWNVNNCIDKTLSRNLFFLFLNIVQTTTCPQLSENLSLKSLGEKCQALRDLEKCLQTKTLVKNMMYPVVKPCSIEITNALNTLQNFFLFHEVGNDMLELLQIFESLHVHDAARKQYRILTYFNQK